MYTYLYNLIKIKSNQVISQLKQVNRIQKIGS